MNLRVRMTLLRRPESPLDRMRPVAGTVTRVETGHREWVTKLHPGTSYEVHMLGLAQHASRYVMGELSLRNQYGRLLGHPVPWSLPVTVGSVSLKAVPTSWPEDDGVWYLRTQVITGHRANVKELLLSQY